jgi:hypothetical protein
VGGLVENECGENFKSDPANDLAWYKGRGADPVCTMAMTDVRTTKGYKDMDDDEKEVYHDSVDFFVGLGFPEAQVRTVPIIGTIAMRQWFEDMGYISKDKIPIPMDPADRPLLVQYGDATGYRTDSGWRLPTKLGVTHPELFFKKYEMFTNEEELSPENLRVYPSPATTLVFQLFKSVYFSEDALEDLGYSGLWDKVPHTLTGNFKDSVYNVFIKRILNTKLDERIRLQEKQEIEALLSSREAERGQSAGGAGPAPSVPPAAAAGTSRSTGNVAEDSDDEPLDLSGVKKRGDEDRLRELEAELKKEEEKKAGLLKKIAGYRKVLSDEMPELKSRKSRLPGLKQEVSTVERDISQLEHRFSVAEKKIIERTEQISVIDATIARLQEEIEDLTPIGKRARSSGALYDHTV